MNGIPTIRDDKISVYIPHMNSHHTKYSVIDIFNEFDIGQVERVDFVPQKSYSGCEAFVHFYPFDTATMDGIIYQHANGGAYRIIVGVEEQWTICQNHNPVPDTTMNIHQIAKHTRELESKLQDLEHVISIIPELTATLQSLNARIQYLEDPEWLSDVSEPLTMNDLTNTSNIYESTRIASSNVIENERYSPVTPMIDWSTRSDDILSSIDTEPANYTSPYYDESVAASLESAGL